MSAKRNIADRMREVIALKTQYAVDLWYRGKHERALLEAEEALSYDPKYIRALNVKAATLAALERFDESIETAKKSVEMDENNGISYSILGICYGYAGKLEEADAAFQKGIELSPKEFITYYNAACHCARIGDYEASVRYLEKAYKIAPTNILGLIEDDIELSPLKKSPQFEEFVKELR
jgi:Flp pilus assembly protein TadD